MDFCNQCLNKDMGNDRKNHCKRCIVFNMNPMDRMALNGLRARDLKWYLASKRIPSHMCNEKGDLIDLILQPFSPQTSGSNVFNSSQYNIRNEGTGAQTQAQTQPQTHSQNISHENQYNFETNVTNNESNQTTSDPINGSNESEKKSTSDNSKIYFNVDDVESEEQLKQLSVKQLKLILTRNFVDYKGCVEKDELLDKVERLWNDRQQNKLQNVDEISDSNLCKICMESTIDCVLLECGHMITCTDCGKRLNECPVCRQYVIRVVHIFKS